MPSWVHENFGARTMGPMFGTVNMAWTLGKILGRMRRRGARQLAIELNATQPPSSDGKIASAAPFKNIPVAGKS